MTKTARVLWCIHSQVYLMGHLISHEGTIYFSGFPGPLAQSAAAFPGFLLVCCIRRKGEGEITCSCSGLFGDA